MCYYIRLCELLYTIEGYDDQLISSLPELGFEQQVSDVTHIKGGLMDHVYYRGRGVSYNAEVSLYSPYYTALDHDALFVTLTKMVE